MGQSTPHKMQTKRIKTKEILSLSLISTGLACYLFSIVRGLGKDTALPFVSPRDLFADFFKFIASYPGNKEVQLENWVPNWLSSTINNYLDANPYSSNPEVSVSSFTNFHLPPVAQIINISTRHLFDLVGPSMSFGIHFAIIFAFIIYLVSIASRTGPLSIETILFSSALIIIYPSIFTLLRGYSVAYLVNLLVCCSFLLAIRANQPGWISVFILSLAIGIRPNYVLFLPLLIIANFHLHPMHSKARQIINASIVTILSLSAALLLASMLYREYTIHTFLNAYGFYSNTYEYGGTDNDWSSSLLQPLLILNKGLAKITGIQPILPSQLKLMCLVLSLITCMWCYMKLYKGKISLTKSILVCSLGVILGTPVFADYHLLILLSPVMVSLYCEHDFSASKVQENLSVISVSESDLPGQHISHTFYEVLSKADGFMIIFMIVPKALPIPGPGSLQTFLNPLAICVYLALTISNPGTKRLKV